MSADSMNDTVSSQTARLILDYWFAEYSPGCLAEKQDKRWFMGGLEVDQEIGRRFGHPVELAIAGGFKDWETEPESRLALIILLDQFTRNIFRSTSRAYAGDPRALKLVRHGLAKRMFVTLPVIQQVFALMPLEHSELLSDQALCVEGMTNLLESTTEKDNPRLQSFLDHAIEHKKIIEVYGRFPHRNHVLARESTDNECCFLSGAKTYGQDQILL